MTIVFCLKHVGQLQTKMQWKKNISGALWEFNELLYTALVLQREEKTGFMVSAAVGVCGSR